MSKPAFTVTIPEPCQENWNEMTPREQGRFCSVCTKTVVDFSTMTDTQLFSVLKNGAGNMCGHFHKEQLDRTITAPKKPKWILQPFWKYFVGLFLFIKPAVAKAQGKPVCTPVIPDKPYVKMGIVAVDNRPKKIEKEITGIIMNTSKQALSGVVINVKGTTKYTTADSKGNFKIKAFVGEMLEITDLQYKNATYRVSDENNVTITLEKTERMFYLGEPAVYTTYATSAQLVIEVTDKVTGKPVKNATVSWTEKNTGNASRKETTNKKGTVNTKILLNQPEITFSVYAKGYMNSDVKFVTTEVAGKKATVLQVQLETAPEVVIVGMYRTKPVEEEEEPVAPVKQEVVPAKKSLSLYPNPVKKSAQVTLSFTNEKAETCMAQVTDIQGKIIMNYRFDAAKGANLVAIPMADNITAGTYMLNLMNSKGQWVATEKVVVE